MTVLAVVLMSHLVTSTAHAHPFGDRFTAQRLEVDVDPGAVRVRLTADVPDALLKYMVPGAADAAGEVLDRLDHGVVVTVDGAHLPLRRLDRTRRVDLVQGTDHVLEATWIVETDLVGRHQVRITNGNLGDQPSYFRDEVRLPIGSRVHATNLVVEHRGKTAALHDAWSPSERLRRIDLDVELPEDGPTVLLRSLQLDPWPIGLARLTPAQGWRAGRTDAPALLGAAVVALIAGLGATLAAGGRRGAVLVGGLAACAAAELGGPGDPGALGVAMAIGALIASLSGELAFVAPLLAAPWAAAAVDARVATMPVLAWMLGAALGLPWRDRRGLGVTLLVVAALVAVTRG